MEYERKDVVKKKKIGRFILIFIVAGVIFSSTAVKNKMEFFSSSEDKTLNIVHESNIQYPEKGNIRVYEDMILKYDEDRVNSYTIEGEATWSKSIPYKEPLIYLGDERFYAADGVSGEIVAYDKEGSIIWENNLKQSIDRIIEKNDNIIVFTKAGDNLGQALIIDKKGKLLANSVVERGRIIYGNISPNCKNYVLSVLDISKDTIESNLIFYSIDGQMLWQESFENQVISFIEFVDDSNIVVASDEKICSINKENKLLWSRNIEGTLQDVVISNDRKQILLLSGENPDILEVISLNGRTEDKIELDKDVEGIYIDGRTTFLFGKENVLGVKSNKIFLRYESNDEIKEISMVDDYLLIITPEKVKSAEILGISN